MPTCWPTVATWGRSCAPSTGRRRRWARFPAGPTRCARPSVSCCATGSRCCSGGDRSSCRSTTTRTSRSRARSTRESMGQTGAECWAEIWHVLAPMVEAPFRGEPATSSDNLELFIERKGFLEETHFKVAYSPVPDESVQPTGIGGVLATVAETTEIVYGERQLRTLRALGATAADAKTPEQACAKAAAMLGANARDVPFAAFYLLDETGETAHLAASCGVQPGCDVAPATIALDAPSNWPVAEVAARRHIEIVTDLRGALRRASGRRLDRSAAHGHRPAAGVARSAARERGDDRGRQPAPRPGRRVPRLLRAGRRAGHDGDPQRLRSPGGTEARRGAGGDRSREDGVLQQRQPRVPDAADADAGADRRTRAKRAARCRARRWTPSTGTSCGC